MKFMKTVAILTGLLTFGMFSSCSNVDEADSGTISIALPGNSERDATSGREAFLDTLTYNAYLVQNASVDYDTSNSEIQTFFTGVAEFFKSVGSIQKQDGSAGDTIVFSDVDSGVYTVYLFYKSEEYSSFGYDKKSVSVTDNGSETINFKFAYPDKVKFNGYTEISSASAFSTDSLSKNVDYPNEDTYDKFYLKNDLTINSGNTVSISTPDSGSYGIVIDLNGHTIYIEDDCKQAMTIGDNTNIVFKNGTIKTGNAGLLTIYEASNSNSAASVKFDGITVKNSSDESGCAFLSMNAGTAVVTGGSSLTTVDLCGGLCVMLGGSIESVSQSNGSLALVEEWTSEEKTFATTGANRITTYKPEDTQSWMLVYFGGDSKIENTVEVGGTATQALKLIQVSDCLTDYFCKIQGTDYVSGESPMLLTAYSAGASPFNLTEPSMENFPLATSDNCSFTWNSEKTSSEDSNITGYCYTCSTK